MRKFKDIEIGGRFFDSSDYYTTLYIKTPLIKDNFGFEFNAVFVFTNGEECQLRLP